MLEMTIDNEILDEVENIAMKGELTNWLFNHTVNFASCAFIIDAIMKAATTVREQLENNKD